MQNFPSLYQWTPNGHQNLDQLLEIREKLRLNGKKVVSTNGCFDLIHAGHVAYLQEAKKQGDFLMVGLNSDNSVRQLKGEGRPYLPSDDRATILTGFSCVDAVVIFDDLLPISFIEAFKPDIHCKAGDYSEESLPEACPIRRYGGKIKIIPLLPGHSTTALVHRILSSIESPAQGNPVINSPAQYLFQSSNILRQAAYQLWSQLDQAIEILIQTVANGKKILICGNGGSAADSQHFATELVVRFENKRRALPAIALTTDTSVLTAIGNDLGYSEVFARQIEALGVEGDLLIAISTSGNSSNVVRAAETAKKLGMQVLTLTGSQPGKLSNLSDLNLAAPSTRTANVQEVHTTILHVLCDQIDQAFLE